MKKLLAVDGNSILNRAFYGIRALTSHDGTPTNAVYGMMNILYRHLTDISPDYFICAFDVHAPTFRHEMYKEYKAGRHATPDELLSQFAPAKECLSALGAVCVEKTGYEADDVLGTYARMCRENNIEGYIVTGDRDSLQLICENVNVLLATTGESVRYDREAFKAKYGIYPDAYVDEKALMGDSSDNIPGVPGVGEKTAGKLISEYGSLDALYENIEEKEIASSLKAKLIAGKELAYLSRTLAKINCFVPDVPSFEETEYKGIDKEKLLTLFDRYDFTALIKRFGLDNIEKKEKQTDIKVPDAVEKENASSDGEKYFASFDFENDVLYLCRGGITEKVSGIKNAEALLLSGKIASSDVKGIYHRLFEKEIAFSPFEDDIMLMGYVVSATEGDFQTEKSARRIFGADVKSAQDEAFWNEKLYHYYKEELEKTNQSKLYTDIELPLSFLLYEMERDGFRVDTEKLAEFSKRLGKTQEELCERVYMQVGFEFNINSPKQLGSALFEKLGLPCNKKTKSGYSTNAETLEALRPIAPVVDDILEYRTVGKLKSTYADGLCAAADKSGRVHTSFRQALTATGRLSSTEPNLQNIPIKTELGREFRKYFVAENENYVLIDADYSQIELRLLAALSGDEAMTEAFNTGADIHSSTAMRIFGVEKDGVSVEMRKRAKAINFGIMYGMGDYSLATDLHITRRQAAEYIENYLRTYPRVREYLYSVIEKAKSDGYVTTLFGRRRYIPELTSRKKTEVAFGERVARNSPIQGTAADIIKLAMVNTARRFKEEKLDARLILQVHDELIAEASASCAEKAKEILKTEMENAVKLSVPLTVSIASGENWLCAH